MRKDLKNRVNNILESVIVNQRTFNYRYYLNKNCAIPIPNWKERKEYLISEAQKGGEARGKVYKELFESGTTEYRNVADFLTEFVANVFPRDFLEGKNRKVFSKKVLQFVKFNRFESFTRVTLLAKFRTQEFQWLGFKASEDKAKYFMNENDFVLWRLLKWVFEDLLVTLQRCYFYCTEKQKEYSRIFYYRKGVWNLIMKLAVDDLLKQTLVSVKKQEMKTFCENNQQAPGKLRLIPKGDTFRPIMTFNRKITGGATGAAQNQGNQPLKRITTNNRLGNAHMMLKNLKSKMFKHAFGFAVFNYDDIMRRYEAFVNRWKEAGSQKLYFVAMDIEKCYDSVECEKLV
jgi:Telomerase ribonucleoprotein complex - RNA binding domain